MEYFKGQPKDQVDCMNDMLNRLWRKVGEEHREHNRGLKLRMYLGGFEYYWLRRSELQGSPLYLDLQHGKWTAFGRPIDIIEVNKDKHLHITFV